MDEERKIPPKRVAVGAHVEIELVDQAGNAERLDFDIVPDRGADFASGFLGEGTPLAKAILGKPAGFKAPYRAGDVAQVHILSVGPGSGVSVKELEARRQAALQKNQEQVERTNLVNFASSFSGKWGDYDPEAVESTERTIKKPGEQEKDNG